MRTHCIIGTPEKVEHIGMQTSHGQYKWAAMVLVSILP